MKQTLLPLLILLVLTLAACSGSHRKNHSVTIGNINWRTPVID